MILFFDTETTGKANFRAPADDASQPRLVQLAALLTDDAGKEMACLSFLVKPEGFEIPTSASAIHGVTTDTARDYGVELVTALQAFGQLAKKAHVHVAHNIKFDALIMEGEFIRTEFDDLPFDGAKTFDTMHAMTDVCKLPGNYGNYKLPKLIEAYRFAFNEEFSGAHDAMADVRACARIYFWLLKFKTSKAQVPKTDLCPQPQ